MNYNPDNWVVLKNEDYTIISLERYKELEESHAVLNELYIAGVDSREGYQIALKALEEEV